MGRKISKTGNEPALSRRLTPHARPCGTPMISARRNPEKIRKRLTVQPFQYLARQKRPLSWKNRVTTLWRMTEASLCPLCCRSEPSS